MNNFDAFTVGMAGIQLGLHNMITSARNGHISPAEVDQALEGVTETLESLTPEMQAMVFKNLDPRFAYLKRIAAENWKES